MDNAVYIMLSKPHPILLVDARCVCVCQVVFSAVQLSWLNVEQAWVVTEKQWADMPWAWRSTRGDVLLEHRGKDSRGRIHRGV